MVEVKMGDVTIFRDFEDSECTLGELIFGKLKLKTLELPDRSNATGDWKNASRILPGRYNAFVRTDGKKGWRLELKDVPGRKFIQIHVGGNVKDSKGCILVSKNDIKKLQKEIRGSEVCVVIKDNFIQ